MDHSKKIASVLVLAFLTLTACSQNTPEEHAVYVSVPKSTCNSLQNTRLCLQEFSNILTKETTRETSVKRLYIVTNETKFGVVTLWHRKPEAENYYTSAFIAELSTRLGAAISVEHFAVPVRASGGNPNSAQNGTSEIAIVKVPTPWYAPRSIVKSRIIEAVPQYQTITGLDHKYFTMGADGTVGGIYLWKDKKSANAFYNEEWQARILETYGQPAELRLMTASQVIVADQSKADAP